MSNILYKGTLTNLILKLLQENGEMYGYEMTKKISSKTNGGLAITEGTLYTILHKLEAELILDVTFKKISGRTRKYYSLSENGKKEAVNKVAELQEFIANLTIFLTPKIT